MTMRAPVLAFLVVLSVMPHASAAGYDLTAGKSFAQDVTSAGPQVFDVPLHANEAGFLYAKLLETPGNAVNDGTIANGSASAKTGWWVEFALLHGSGTRVELGAFSDGNASPLEPISSGEDAKLVVTVHWPASAAQPNADDRVYGALAFRPNATGTAAGTTSGATMDMARSFNVELRFPATLPPPSAPPPATDASPVVTAHPSPSPTPPVSAISSGGEVPAASRETGSGSSALSSASSVPAWFLAVVAVEGAAIILLAVCCLVLVLFILRREQPARTHVPAVSRTLPVSEQTTSAAAEDATSTLAAREKR